ncbi:hypothetical protein GQ600_8168 [Phytophthora cactorum]|nr:hypothetical protein GQ600_8168 [Phytophthora cactorum]
MRSGGEGEAVTEPVYPIYHWGGGMRLFPLCMKIPTGSEKQPWRVLVLRRYTTYLTTVSSVNMPSSCRVQHKPAGNGVGDSLFEFQLQYFCFGTVMHVMHVLILRL